MQPLANKGTRKFMFWMLTLGTIVAFVYGATTPEAVRMPTFEQGTEFIKWLFGFYALSEVGSKGAEV